jgi:hypothetical protein
MQKVRAGYQNNGRIINISIGEVFVDRTAIATGKVKGRLGWTPLHLATYFGHSKVAEALLKAGAGMRVELSRAGKA